MSKEGRCYDEDSKSLIAFVAFPGLTLLDLVGPLQVLKQLERFELGYRTLVVAERLEPMETDTGLAINPETTFEENQRPRAIIVPGGDTRTARKNPRILDYVRRCAETADVVGSVCTGSLILGEAGLLKGRDATTHWNARNMLETYGAKFTRKRWVEDGKMITSAGVSAGIDMALAIVQKLEGDEAARYVQLYLEYDPKPPLGRVDWTLAKRILSGEAPARPPPKSTVLACLHRRRARWLPTRAYVL